MIISQILTERRQIELAVVALFTGSQCNQSDQDTSKCGGIGSDDSGKVGCSSVAFPDAIGEPKLRGYVEDLRTLSAERRMEERSDGSLRMIRIRHAAPPSDRLLYDLIRPRQQRRRDGEAEGLGGLEVDNQLELGRLLDGQITRFDPLQDPVHVESGAAEHVR